MSEKLYGDINVLARQMELFGAISPNMPFMTIMAFLFVATRGTCHQKDFENQSQINDAQASRSISYWCDFVKHGEKGMSFIDRREDPSNRRYRLLSLTKKGQVFAEKLKLGRKSEN